MLSPSLAERIESGMTLLIGTVSADGRPSGVRGWGIRLVDADAGLLRVLFDANDTATRANLADGGHVAITSCDVKTLFAVQLKGHALTVEPPDADDLRAAETWADAFLGAVVAIDGYTRAQLEQWRRRDLVTALVHIEQAYDQTPGPGAGGDLTDGPS